MQKKEEKRKEKTNFPKQMPKFFNLMQGIPI